MPILGAATISGSAVARKERERRAVERQSVVLARHAQRLAEPARAGREQSDVVETAPVAHPVEAMGRLQRPQQDRRRRALLLADEVEAPVDPVGAVDVRVARRAEHDGVPRRPAAEGVAGRVGRIVGLDLDDRAADPVDEQRDADQVGRDLVDAAREEGRGERVRHPFRGSGSSRRSGRGSGLRRGSRLRRLRRRSRRRRSRSGGW